MITILFLAADPTDASRLRLGQEYRDIQEKLQLSKLRNRIVLHQRMSVRPGDISQALLDIEPNIVHFSGHGTESGELCLENELGETENVKPNALAALFALMAERVSCVVLNACYSEVQANAISEHIEYVIGMKEAIGDKAAISFATGFYKAIGANRSIEKAYKFGCTEIQIHNIPGHLKPVLLKKTLKNDKIGLLERTKRFLPDNLPSVQNWVGRSQELDLLKAKILDNKTRAIGITGSAVGVVGSAGIGKTVLASKLMHLLQNGPFIVAAWETLKTDLGTKKPPDFNSFINSLLFTLSDGKITAALTARKDYRFKTNQIIKLLKEKACLIVLDNVESILTVEDIKRAGYFSADCEEYAWLLKELVSADHKSKIVFTSRESIVELSRSNYEQLTLSGLDRQASIEFLRSFKLRATKEELEKLVLRYRGHPKALELVAALIRDHPEYKGKVDRFLPDQKWFVIHDIDMLLGEMMERLSEQEKECLNRVSVYQPEEYPILISAISFLMPDVEEYDLKENIVLALVRRQLLDYDSERETYQLHPLVQEKAYRLLSRDPGDLQISHQRAYRYFLSIPLKVESEWKNVEDIKPLLRMHYHACQAKAWDQAAEAVENIGYDYLYRWSEFRLMLNLYDRLLPADWRQGKKKVNSIKLHIDILKNIGIACYNLGYYESAIDYNKQAIAISRRTDENNSEARSLSNLGLIYHRLGQYETAIEFHKQALSIARSIDDRLTEGRILNNIGLTYHYLGQYQTAIEYHQKRLDIAIDIGDKLGEASGLDNWGRTHKELKQFPAAIEKLLRALEILKELGKRHGQADVLKELAEIHQRCGNIDTAILYCDRSIIIAEELGMPLAEECRKWKHRILSGNPY